SVAVRRLRKGLQSLQIHLGEACAGKGRDSCAGNSGGLLKRIDSMTQSPLYVQCRFLRFNSLRDKWMPRNYTNVKELMEWLINVLHNKNLDEIVFPGDEIFFPNLEIENCATSDGEIGTCTFISSCQPILEFLDNVPRPLSMEVRNLLKSYICEYEGEKAQVCCPTKPIKIPKSQPLKIAPPPNVDHHRNMNLLPKNCGSVDTTDRIFYGSKTGLFEFPWMALLFYETKRGPNFRCGGTIINNRYILTAAHCISNKLIKVRVGEHDIGTKIDCRKIYGERICAPPFKDLDIESVISHPKFDRRTHSHDVALL
ncbi:Trypsin and/or CLIP domain containing protein, partial [Asbolus verrucosus]